jgi:hypothetical protein
LPDQKGFICVGGGGRARYETRAKKAAAFFLQVFWQARREARAGKEAKGQGEAEVDPSFVQRGGVREERQGLGPGVCAGGLLFLLRVTYSSWYCGRKARRR